MTRKHLSQPWFDLIKNGSKTYEGRLNTSFWQELKVDDMITFYNGEFSFDVKVISRQLYSSFKDGITEIGIQHVLPTYVDTDIDIAINDVYYQYYSPEDENNYGVVMFEMKCVTK